MPFLLLCCAVLCTSLAACLLASHIRAVLRCVALHVPQESLQLSAIVDKLRRSLDSATIASMAEFVYSHPASATDPAIALVREIQCRATATCYLLDVQPFWRGYYTL